MERRTPTTFWSGGVFTAIAVVCASLLSAAALIVSTEPNTSYAPTTVLYLGIPPQHSNTPHHHTAPLVISGLADFTETGPELSVTFWTGSASAQLFINVTAGFDMSGQPTITTGGNAPLFSMEKLSTIDGYPYLYVVTSAGPAIFGFTTSENGKWAHPYYKLLTSPMAVCTAPVFLVPIRGRVSVGGFYKVYAEFTPSGPAIAVNGIRNRVTELGFSKEAPYSPYAVFRTSPPARTAPFRGKRTQTHLSFK